MRTHYLCPLSYLTYFDTSFQISFQLYVEDAENYYCCWLVNLSSADCRTTLFSDLLAKPKATSTYLGTKKTFFSDLCKVLSVWFLIFMPYHAVLFLFENLQKQKQKNTLAFSKPRIDSWCERWEKFRNQHLDLFLSTVLWAAPFLTAVTPGRNAPMRLYSQMDGPSSPAELTPPWDHKWSFNCLCLLRHA